MTNNNSRTKNISGKLDSEAFEDLKRFGRITNWGHCRLVSLGAYIILATFRNAERSLIEDGKTMEDMYKVFGKFQGHMFRGIEKLIDPIFKEDLIISQKLQQEILDIIIEQKVFVNKNERRNP